MGVGYNPRIVTSGLVGYWDAGNTKSYPGSGTAWNDISGKNQTGTLTNSPTYSSGAISFTKASSQYVNVPDSDNLSFTNNIFTMNLWVKFNNTTANQGVIGKMNVAWEYSIHIATTGTLSFYTWTTGGTVVYTNTYSLSASTWYNFCWTADGTNSYLYVNGAFNTQAAKNAGQNMGNSTSALYFGAGGEAMIGTVYLDGQISNFSLYNQAFSAQQVAQNFNALRGRFGI